MSAQNNSRGFDQKQITTAKFGDNEGFKMMHRQDSIEVREKPFSSDMANRN